jgi:hypothetical protein
MTDMDVIHATEETLLQYLGGLTEAEFDEAEKTEADLNALVSQGFTARAMLALVRGVPAIRKLSPTAKLEGIFDLAVAHGINVILYSLKHGTPELRQNERTRIARKSGHERGRLVR